MVFAYTVLALFDRTSGGGVVALGFLSFGKVHPQSSHEVRISVGKLRLVNRLLKRFG